MYRPRFEPPTARVQLRFIPLYFMSIVTCENCMDVYIVTVAILVSSHVQLVLKL
jgi:hypothetical protein